MHVAKLVMKAKLGDSQAVLLHLPLPSVDGQGGREESGTREWTLLDALM